MVGLKAIWLETVWFDRQEIQTVLGPVCFVCAWVLVLMTGLSLSRAIFTGLAQAERMHQIPCSGCQFFTGDYRLKCPVHPAKAMSEAAIGCRDYEDRSVPWIS